VKSKIKIRAIVGPYKGRGKNSLSLFLYAKPNLIFMLATCRSGDIGYNGKYLLTVLQVATRKDKVTNVRIQESVHSVGILGWAR